MALPREMIPAGTTVRFINKDYVSSDWWSYVGYEFTVVRDHGVNDGGYVFVAERLNDRDNGNWPRGAMEIVSHVIDSTAYDEAMKAMEIYEQVIK